MPRIKLENKKGDILELSRDGDFILTDIQGLAPPDSTINTSETALLDGSRYNSAKTNSRQLLLEITINKNPAENRIVLYKVLKTKQWIKFYYEGRFRNVTIEGYIQSMPINYTAKKQYMSLDILCPNPFFKDVDEIRAELNYTTALFSFPFAITEDDPIPISEIDVLDSLIVSNDGDFENGMVLEILCNGTVINPKISNYVTTDYIGVNYELQAGDSVFISTIKGEKSITLLRDGAETNIFNYVMDGSTWLLLEPGTNEFIYDADEGKTMMNVIVTFSPMYEGV